ncbi:hypothetical protein MASR1M45_18690 [Candidatus Kapaibacterium sp.]
MNDIILKNLSLATQLEEQGINFFSGLSRKFHRNIDLKINFETFAKSKIATKQMISDLSKNAATLSFRNSGSTPANLDSAPILSAIEETEVVGEHSLLGDVLITAFNYLRESNKMYQYLSQYIDSPSVFGRIIAENKLIMEVIKKHIHDYTQEYKFYGYE